MEEKRYLQKFLWYRKRFHPCFPRKKTGHRRGSLFLGICLLVFAVLFFDGCGKHKCAICGKEAGSSLNVSGKNFHVCEECYRVYVEEQHLFDEDL